METNVFKEWIFLKVIYSSKALTKPHIEFHSMEYIKFSYFMYISLYSICQWSLLFLTLKIKIFLFIFILVY